MPQIGTVRKKSQAEDRWGDEQCKKTLIQERKMNLQHHS